MSQHRKRLTQLRKFNHKCFPSLGISCCTTKTTNTSAEYSLGSLEILYLELQRLNLLMNVFVSVSVLSEWSDGSVGAGLSDQQPASPALQYVCEGVLRAWCSQAQWMEEVLEELRTRLAPQLQRVGLQARGRALGG